MTTAQSFRGLREGFDALPMSKPGNSSRQVAKMESLFFTFAPLCLARDHSVELQL
jgi:hypothetical protein